MSHTLRKADTSIHFKSKSLKTNTRHPPLHCMHNVFEIFLFKTYLTVAYRPVYCVVSLQSNRHSHEYGPSHGHGMQRVQKVRKKQQMQVCLQIEPLPAGLQDGGEKVRVVNHGQSNEEQIKGIAHRFASQNVSTESIAKNARTANHAKNHAFDPKGELFQKVIVVVAILGTDQFCLVERLRKQRLVCKHWILSRCSHLKMQCSSIFIFYEGNLAWSTDVYNFDMFTFVVHLPF